MGGNRSTQAGVRSSSRSSAEFYFCSILYVSRAIPLRPPPSRTSSSGLFYSEAANASAACIARRWDQVWDVELVSARSGRTVVPGVKQGSDTPVSCNCKWNKCRACPLVLRTACASRASGVRINYARKRPMRLCAMFARFSRSDMRLI